MKAEDVIKHFRMRPLRDEGGYFSEFYKSDLTIPPEILPGFSGKRAVATSIYYLITVSEYSFFRVLRSDEIWHFYAGDTTRMHQILPDGSYRCFTLGANFLKGEFLQVVVPAGVYAGSRLIEGGEWALFGCSVAPGFDFDDFYVPPVDELCARFPQHAKLFQSHYTN